MLMESAPGPHGPEVGDVGIVAVCEDPRLGQVLKQDILRPERAAPFVSPCTFAIARQSVHKDNA